MGREIKLLSQLSGTEKIENDYEAQENLCYEFGNGHPNIMKLFDAIDTPKQLYLILENVKGKMLNDILKE